MDNRHNHTSLDELLERAQEVDQELSQDNPMSAQDIQRERHEAVLKRIDDLTQDTGEHSIGAGAWMQRYGTAVMARFLKFGLFCLGLFLLSIMWGYHFSMTDKKASTLERRLEDLRYKSLFSTAELIKHEQISSIQRSLEAQGLDLEVSTHPPYEIIDRTTVP